MAEPFLFKGDYGFPRRRFAPPRNETRENIVSAALQIFVTNAERHIPVIANLSKTGVAIRSFCYYREVTDSIARFQQARNGSKKLLSLRLFFCQTSQTAKKLGASSNGTFSEIIFSHPNLSAFCISSVLRISYKKVFVNQFFEPETYFVRLYKKQGQILCKQNKNL